MSDGPYRTRSGERRYGTRRPFPTPSGIARDTPSRRRARHRAIPHATSLIARDQATGHSRSDGHDGMRSGDGRYGTRRSSRVRRCPEMPGIGPEMPGNARNMFGISSIIPDDVSLPGLSGDRFTGCERPNAGPQLRRWQVCRSAQLLGTRRAL